MICVRRCRTALLAALVAFAAVGTAGAKAAQLTTLAGSGRAGIEDGSASQASFLMPEGIAVEKDGTIIVCDTAAQRVREVLVNGQVLTIAGSGAIGPTGLWVRGGYRDGAVSIAQFNRPTAAAVAPDGSIIVADRGNHVLRRIAHGLVTTYAGSAAHAGTADGTLATATFSDPDALEYDAAGNLYVGDFTGGVREITPAGIVSTLPLPQERSKGVTGLSVLSNGSNTSLYVALLGVGVQVMRDGVPAEYYMQGAEHGGIFIEGRRSIGFPYAIVAMNDDTFVYTDIRNGDVRVMSGNETYVAAGADSENASFSGQRFADGSATGARLDTPMGLAVLPSGGYAIADSGNRRIRFMSAVDFRHVAANGTLAAASKSYRILYVGNSFTSYDQQWDESISGILEARLRRNWAAAGFPREPKVFPVQLIAALPADRDYIEAYPAAGLADLVVWQINTYQVYGLVNHDLFLGDDWVPKLTRMVAEVRARLRAAGIPLVVCINPLPSAISPVESTYGNLVIAPSLPDVDAFAPLMVKLRAAVQAAGVPVVDLDPLFHAVELEPDHPALFAGLDDHFSLAGAALAAKAIGDELLALQPWKR